jgi:hypothetical protein
MKKQTALATILLAVCCLFAGIGPAYSRVGFYIGAPFPYYYGYGYPYPYPYYYPPAVVTAPAPQQNYIIQQPMAPAQQNPSASYWHYCKDPEGYYPYIKECPSGWQLVEPTPQH